MESKRGLGRMAVAAMVLWGMAMTGCGSGAPTVRTGWFPSEIDPAARVDGGRLLRRACVAEVNRQCVAGAGPVTACLGPGIRECESHYRRGLLALDAERAQMKRGLVSSTR